MPSFVEFLRSLPGSGRIHVKCLYTPSQNDATRFPAQVVSGTITMRMTVGEYQNFEDWLRNDDANTLSPMKIKWSNGSTRVEVDLDDESLKLWSSDNRAVQLANAYAQSAHLTFQIRED